MADITENRNEKEKNESEQSVILMDLSVFPNSSRISPRDHWSQVATVSDSALSNREQNGSD
jgi:hypothetical protein